MKVRATTPLSAVPEKPAYNPVRDALHAAADRPEIASALKLFASMPPSTGVFANPVRHKSQLHCGDTAIQVDIREFTLRGVIQEHEIVSRDHDGARTIFAGLFARLPIAAEDRMFRRLLDAAFRRGWDRALQSTAEFMKRFPDAGPDLAMQHWAVVRKASRAPAPQGGVNSGRAPEELLKEMIHVHLENVAVASASSYMRSLLAKTKSPSTTALTRKTTEFAETMGKGNAWVALFALLLRRRPSRAETALLDSMGAIQVHHGSAGSNMAARYLSSLHTRSVSDLFTASQMTLDCGRHFGAISDMTDFVRALERTPAKRRDASIRARILGGNLPTFGHPEISAASRGDHLEMDPRPAIYLSLLFDAIDKEGVGAISARTVSRAALLERMYQIAFVDGVEKTGGRLRLTPNTDFGAWLVQETLGIEEPDRTLLSYAYRGFGWMMDAREQLQQPIIRPVIPPDPTLTSAAVDSANAAHGNLVPKLVGAVHERLMKGGALERQA